MNSENRKCKLFGHEIGNFHPDGYDLCERCHETNHPAYNEFAEDGTPVEWQDWEFNKCAYLLRPLWWIRDLVTGWIEKFKNWRQMRRIMNGKELPF